MAYRSKSGMTKQEVLEVIRDKILYLELKPGEVINDIELAEKLNVSRTPVRESLLILQRENLVDIYPQSGTFVSLLDLELIREIVYIRHIIECEILMKLIHEKPDIKSKVERYLYLQELAVRNNDQREYVKNDHLFHNELFALAGHSRAWKLIEGQYNHTIRFHILDFFDREIFGQSLAEHILITKYLEEGNKDKLKEILDLHHDCELRSSDTLVSKFEDYFIKQA